MFSKKFLFRSLMFATAFGMALTSCTKDDLEKLRRKNTGHEQGGGSSIDSTKNNGGDSTENGDSSENGGSNDSTNMNDTGSQMPNVIYGESYLDTVQNIYWRKTYTYSRTMNSNIRLYTMKNVKYAVGSNAVLQEFTDNGEWYNNEYPAGEWRKLP